MKVASIDVYVSYRCDLRCKHCFLGDHLSTNITFPMEELTALADTCPQWETREITLLGGEPTLYPEVVPLVKYIQAKGLNTRLVTNGQRGFTKFMDEFDGDQTPTVYFSIDGSCPEVHDAIRGKGTFNRLVANIRRSQEFHYRAFGIMSVGRQNAHDVVATLRVCDHLGLQHVNVHYVTNRGFATAESLIPLSEWQSIRESVEEASASMRVAVRTDHSLAPFREYTGYCSVRSQDNLMFYPDGRVFICALFFDVPEAHAFEWRNGRLIPNPAKRNEISICQSSTEQCCPAMSSVNADLLDQAVDLGCTVGCIYEKVDVRQGVATIDSACAPGHPEVAPPQQTPFPVLGGNS